MWNGIGGKIEAGEDPFAACVREIREETALPVAQPALRALLVISIKSTSDLWLIFVFSAAAPDREPVASEEGALAWVAMSQVTSLPVPADLPLILPHALDGNEIVVARIEYETEDATSLARAEILGPA